MELTPQQAIDYANCSDELPIMDPSVLARAAYPTYGRHPLGRNPSELVRAYESGDDLVTDQYENGFWWEGGPITEALPAPFSLTRAHCRIVRGAHIVMRTLLERRRATLGKDALFVIYNLYRRMPDPMFRVIISFL